MGAIKPSTGSMMTHDKIADRAAEKLVRFIADILQINNTRKIDAATLLFKLCRYRVRKRGDRTARQVMKCWPIDGGVVSGSVVG